jgi:hypothetical protein
MVDLEAVSKCVSSQVIAFINSDRSRYLCLSAAAALLKYIEFIQVSSLVSEPCTARLPTHPQSITFAPNSMQVLLDLFRSTLPPFCRSPSRDQKERC